MAEKLDVEHQVCQFHVRHWVIRTLREMRETVPKDWLWVLDEIKDFLDELPPQGCKRLFELWKHTPVEKSARDEPTTPSE